MAFSRQQKPKIGVSSRLPVEPSLAAIMTQLRSAGAEPVLLAHPEPTSKSVIAKAVAEDLAQLDGLVVMGNSDDINPAKYGQAVHPKTQVETNYRREAYEDEAIAQALELKMPFMGVCGGLQRLNTLSHAENGGTLHQHVPDVVGSGVHSQGNTMEGTPPFTPVHYIKIHPGTVLADVAGKGEGLFAPSSQDKEQVLEENSFHHQAVDCVHKEFRVSAVSEDGIIEAIEPKPDGKYADQYVMGLQWHPEFGASEIGPKLAQKLVQEAKSYARAKQAPAVGEISAKYVVNRDASATRDIL